MTELAVVGPDLFTLGFKLAGVRRAHTVEGPKELDAEVRKLLEDTRIGVLVMQSEDLLKLEPSLRRRLEENINPTLVAIGTREDTTLREKLKQAIGVDVWK